MFHVTEKTAVHCLKETETELSLGGKEEAEEGPVDVPVAGGAGFQLCHKAQTVSQINHKLEAQLVDLKSELTETRAEKAVLEKEVHDQLLQLHAKTGQSVDSGAIKAKLERELEANKKEKVKEAQLEAEVKLLRKENEALHRHIAVLQAEVYGARLAAKYLDKELAGRVQQIQLLGDRVV
uniref:Uncharacterized protein n=1 Tax=Sphaerodactylus townsendi TaxID=933632 RepID=A0ACB8GDW9_9SAUR